MMLSPDRALPILCWLRAAALAGQVIAIGTARWVLGPGLETWALLGVSGGYALWHGLLLLQTRRGLLLGEGRLALEILVDVVVITALLCLAGGWNNPFASIYLVPLGFAAALLPLPATLVLLGCAMAGYTLTAFWFVPLPHVAPVHGDSGAASMHLVGMALSFVLASVVMVVAVSLVRRAHDGERRALAQERESRLRDEQVLSLGVLAASTAHELGTPLSTARMLVEELQESGSSREVSLLGQQLDLAMGHLRRLVRVADRGDEEVVDLGSFCVQIADRFRTLRPDTELVVTHDLGPGRAVCYSRALESALLSLLVNAATASSRGGCTRVEFTATVRREVLTLRVRDFGPGFDPEAVDGASRGLGVGLVISSATIDSHGGEARHFSRDPGTEVVVTLPLGPLGAP